VNLRTAAGTEIGTNGSPVRTDPTGGTAQPVTDNSGSLTVDAPVGTPVFVRLSDGSAAITRLGVTENPTRTYVTLFAADITGITTEGVFTFSKNVSGSVTGGQTAYTITNAKTFRIQAINVMVKNTTTVANNITVNVRVGASANASSPLVASVSASAPVAVATARGAYCLTFAGGIDIAGDGTIQIAISHIENVTTASIANFTLTGYEY
jgi:hypothetical protein